MRLLDVGNVSQTLSEPVRVSYRSAVLVAHPGSVVVHRHNQRIWW